MAFHVQGDLRTESFLEQVACEMERQFRAAGYEGWRVVHRPRTGLDRTFSQTEQFGLIFEDENDIQDMEQFGLIPEEAGDIGRTGADFQIDAVSPKVEIRIPDCSPGPWARPRTGVKLSAVELAREWAHHAMLLIQAEG